MTKATDITTWRAACSVLARESRNWEAVARNLAGCFADGPAALQRQMQAHGLIDATESTTIPTDSEGIE